MTLEMNSFTAYVALASVAGIFLVGKWVGGVNSDRSGFKEFMKEIKADIKDIKATINTIFEKLPSSAVSSNSPLQLTGIGDEISKNLKAEDWAAETALSMADRVKGK